MYKVALNNLKIKESIFNKVNILQNKIIKAESFIY